MPPQRVNKSTNKLINELLEAEIPELKALKEVKPLSDEVEALNRAEIEIANGDVKNFDDINFYDN